MKACQALTQIGHEVTLIVPGNPHSTISNLQLASHYGLRTPFEVIWLPARDRRLFTWNAVRRARRLGAEALYVWPLQSAVIGLLANLPVILEMHDLPTGVLGPVWYRWFLHRRGRKRLLLIPDALRRALQLEYKLNLAELDVVISRKLRTPAQPELAMGAVAEDGELFLNQMVIREVGVTDDEIQKEKERQLAEIRRRNELLRKFAPRIPLKDRIVVVNYPDGLAAIFSYQKFQKIKRNLPEQVKYTVISRISSLNDILDAKSMSANVD